MFTLSSYTRRKPVEKSLSEETSERTLTWVDLTMYGIAATVGSGIYAVVGEVASGSYENSKTLATGPAVILSTLIAAALSLMTSICYLEFASALPISGSGYAYFYSMIGEFLGWLIGWNLTLEYAFCAAALAGKWSQNLLSLIADNTSTEFMSKINWIFYSSLTGDNQSLFRLNLIAPLLVLVVGFIVSRGVKMGTRFTNAATIMNLSLILFVIVVGACKVNPANWTPFIADVSEAAAKANVPEPSAISRIVAGGAIMFFCFIGYDTVSTLSTDAVNPARDIPIAAFLTIGTAGMLYAAAGFILTGMVRTGEIKSESPLASAFNSVGLPWAAAIVKGFSLVNIAITVLACLMGQPKIFAAIARDGLLPPSLAKENERGVAAGSVALVIFGTALLTMFYDVNRGLIDMISAGCLFSMAAVCAGMLVARYNAAPADLRARGNYTVMTFFTMSLLACFLITYWATWIGYCVAGLAILLPFSVLLSDFIRFPAALKPVSASENSFVCPLMPWLPCVAVLANLYVMSSISVANLMMFLGWAVIGVAVYLFYGLHHSKLGLEMESVAEFGKF